MIKVKSDHAASNNVQEATTLAASREGIKTLNLDVSDQEALSRAVEASDIVVR
jgi:saccharopine dehydrogenase-like NADP-dependent oxidoreductase